MYQWFLVFILLIILLLVVLYNVVNYVEPHALYYPSKKTVWRPKIPYKQVYINVNDVKDVVENKNSKNRKADYICAWHFNNFDGRKTVMFCHGTTGNISHRKYIIDICHKFKLNLLLFDTRGYYKSSAFPDKLFLREDGEVAFKYLRDFCQIKSNEIIVWGESLGGVPAVWVASKYNCGGLILLSTFSSLDDLIVNNLEGYKKTGASIATKILSYQMDMIPLKDYMKYVKCPIAVIHSDEDDLIPYICAQNNYKNISHNNKIFITIKGGHSSPEIRSDQLKEVFDFCSLPLDYSSDVDVSEMLGSLRTVAAKYHNFIESY